MPSALSVGRVTKHLDGYEQMDAKLTPICKSQPSISIDGGLSEIIHAKGGHEQEAAPLDLEHPLDL